MSRAHVEIGHLIRQLGRLLDDVGADGPDESELARLRQVLYGLHAICSLHFAQEEEAYFSLVEEPSDEAPPLAS